MRKFYYILILSLAACLNAAAGSASVTFTALAASADITAVQYP